MTIGPSLQSTSTPRLGPCPKGFVEWISRIPLYLSEQTKGPEQRLAELRLEYQAAKQQRSLLEGEIAQLNRRIASTCSRLSRFGLGFLTRTKWFISRKTLKVQQVDKLKAESTRHHNRMADLADEIKAQEKVLQAFAVAIPFWKTITDYASFAASEWKKLSANPLIHRVTCSAPSDNDYGDLEVLTHPLVAQCVGLPGDYRDIGVLKVYFPISTEEEPEVRNQTHRVYHELNGRAYLFDAPHMPRGGNCWGKATHQLSILRGRIADTVVEVIAALKIAGGEDGEDEWGKPVFLKYPRVSRPRSTLRRQT